jgi:hypothetical protein
MKMTRKLVDELANARLDRAPRRVFTHLEDKLLASIVRQSRHRDWVAIAAQLPGCTPRQCRDRWTTYLAPFISFHPWRIEEDVLITRLVVEIGTKWSIIAKYVPGRTGNAIKNRWNTELRWSSGREWCQSDVSDLRWLSDNQRIDDINSIVFENEKDKLEWWKCEDGNFSDVPQDQLGNGAWG